jgi:hypothetical protein
MGTVEGLKVIRMEELRQLVTDNPGLPVYAWVDTDVVGGDGYSKWWGDVTRARLAKVTHCTAGRSDEESDVWEWGDKDDLAQYIVEGPTGYLDGKWAYVYDGNDPSTGWSLGHNTCDGDTVSDDELYALAAAYVNALEWEDCILLDVGL